MRHVMYRDGSTKDDVGAPQRDSHHCTHIHRVPAHQHDNVRTSSIFIDVAMRGKPALHIDYFYMRASAVLCAGFR